MKVIIVTKKLLLLFASLVVAISCEDPESLLCKLTKFYWEGQWHHAEYNDAGRLSELIADSSKIYFHYDDSHRLVKAEIHTAEASPKYWFEFAHGPYGITEVHEYHLSAFGTAHNFYTMHYASPMRIDYIILKEYSDIGDPLPGFIIQYDLTYNGSSNVTAIKGTSTVIHTLYSGHKYDNKDNPFRKLAAAVGNPAFFPVCHFANFPGKYNVSFLSLFSRNNPVYGQYKVPGVDPEEQRFDNAYDGSLANKIVWNNTNYGTTTSEEYAFQFECLKEKITD